MIIINKATNQLAFYEDGELVVIFDVGTGKEKEDTPEGTFKVVNKIKNRPYYKDKIPGGDPRNPLGDRWIGLNARGTWGTTYAIHGNNNVSSIGKYISAGCIRMHNKEVHWLFEQIKINTPVYITDSKDSFEVLAKHQNYEVKSTEPVEIDTPLTLLERTPLFNKPSKYHETKMALTPQKVKAFEKVNDWYRIKTWYGDAWIKGAHIIEGEIQTVSEEITLGEKTYLYREPFGGGRAIGALAPQTVKAFEQWNDWYRIKSWLGDVWIKVEAEKAEEN